MTTTVLFSLLDDMEAAIKAVPALTNMVGVERTLPIDSAALPQMSLMPRRTEPNGLGPEVQSREGAVFLTVRATGDKPGRIAHELLAQAHQALMRDESLNDGAVHIELGVETFRYVDSEQTVVDLQAEYQITFCHSRDSLLS